jgi:hypothetical protein
MQLSVINEALSRVVRETYEKFLAGRGSTSLPDAVVAVFPQEKGFLLRAASFPKLAVFGEAFARHGEVATKVKELLQGREVLSGRETASFVCKKVATTHGPQQYSWSMFMNDAETDYEGFGPKEIFVPTISD